MQIGKLDPLKSHDIAGKDRIELGCSLGDLELGAHGTRQMSISGLPSDYYPRLEGKATGWAGMTVSPKFSMLLP